MSIRTKSFDLLVSPDDNNYARTEESAGRREQESVREVGKSHAIRSALFFQKLYTKCVADSFDKKFEVDIFLLKKKKVTSIKKLQIIKYNYKA